MDDESNLNFTKLLVDNKNPTVPVPGNQRPTVLVPTSLLFLNWSGRPTLSVMAQMWTEDYVWGEINALAKEVAEQTQIIQELREWEEAEHRYQTDREATLRVLNADIERNKQRKLRELKRGWDGKRSPPSGIFAWDQHARAQRGRNNHPVEVGQCWFPPTETTAPTIPSNTTTDSGLSGTPIPITTSAVDKPLSGCCSDMSYWSASEADALIAAISKNTREWPSGLRRIQWKEVSSDLAELGYARSESACKEHNYRLQNPRPPPPTPAPQVCLCGACNNREYGSNAWRLIQGKTCCKTSCSRPQHPSNYSNCALHRDPTKDMEKALMLQRG